MSDRVELLELTLKNINKIFNLNKIDLDQVIFNKDILLTLGFKYGIIYNYDSVKFGDLEELYLDKDNILEARFFNNNYELVIRIDNDIISGNLFIDNGEKEENYKEDYFILYKSKNSDNEKYKKIVVKKYIDYDEDGQAYYYYMKPCRLESGE